MLVTVCGAELESSAFVSSSSILRFFYCKNFPLASIVEEKSTKHDVSWNGEPGISDERVWRSFLSKWRGKRPWHGSGQHAACVC